MGTALAGCGPLGTVASCGLAASADLPATVLPFILRGITLTGINSVYASRAQREEAWARLATDLDLGLLDGAVRGRTVVDVRR